MTNKILITGVSGFIGSHLAKYLSTLNNSEIFGIDRLSNTSSNSNYLFKQCDLLSLSSLVELLITFQPTEIFHLAARTDLNERQNIEGYASNVKGVENLIDAIRQCPSVKRCIFTSSQLVCKVGHIPKDEYEYVPNTLYGESKVLTEKIVRKNDGGGVEWCIVRPTTVWGPGMSPHYQRLFNMIQNRRYFHVGSRRRFKSYSYIGNITYQYLKLLQAPVDQIHRQTFYLADYQPLSLIDWANTIQAQLNAPPIPTYPEFFVKLIAKLGDLINTVGFKQFPFNSFRLNNVLTEYVFDLSKTEAVCGELPYSLEEGVAETVAWIKELDSCSTIDTDLND